jgi:hypothetical protein
LRNAGEGAFLVCQSAFASGLDCASLMSNRPSFLALAATFSAAVSRPSFCPSTSIINIAPACSGRSLVEYCRIMLIALPSINFSAQGMNGLRSKNAFGSKKVSQQRQKISW